MRLADFSVVNYRSITTARKIKTNNMTVLVGKNNEGKSNILRALTLAMDIMKICTTYLRQGGTTILSKLYGTAKACGKTCSTETGNGMSESIKLFWFTQLQKYQKSSGHFKGLFSPEYPVPEKKGNIHMLDDLVDRGDRKGDDFLEKR